MSLLETPRVCFRGRITWDPIVTNNYTRFYDETDSQTALRPGETAAEFRKSAIDAVTIGKDGGNWNPDGTHRSVFFDTSVTSVELDGGPDTHDALVGQPVDLRGMLVDSEPYGSFSSQLFFDWMRFGIDGTCRVLLPRSTRMTARRIHFHRNSGYQYIAGGASVSWQTAFPKEKGLRVDAHDSQALSTLSKLLDDDDVLGLAVRWNAYRTVYFDNPDMSDDQVAKAAYQQLQNALRGGGFQPNPARSEVVGVLGIWRRGEPAAVGGDRFLASAVKGNPIGSAYARLGTSQVTLDLQNSIPETGLDLQKKDFGPLQLVSSDPHGKESERVLATLEYEQYRRQAYERFGGLVTVPIQPEDARQASERDLRLRGRDGTDYLVEKPLYACPEEPNLYLDEGEQRELVVRILQRGKPAGGGVPLRVVSMTDGAERRFGSDAQGVVRVPLEGVKAGVEGRMLVAGDGPAPTPRAFDPVIDPYFYQRTLAADAKLAELPATWENVYRHVLINWHAMAPCMDNWLRLGDAAQVARYADLLRQLTSKARFEEYRFMPVTRDMTAGQRNLLYRWLDTQARMHEQPKSMPSDATPPAERTAAELGRAHRRPETPGTDV